MNIKASPITSCKECNSTDLSWQTVNTVRSGIQQGRLNSNDVECQFYLGCNECSETLAILNADQVTDLLNSQAA